MQALRKTAPVPGALLQPCPLPKEPGAGEVVIEVAATGICGSDLHAYDWDSGYAFMAPFLPLTLGHEFAGRVLAVGAGVETHKPGDAVVCWPTITCGQCAPCSAGKPLYCTERRIIGLHRDGGFARQVTMPARNALLLPAGLPLEIAALAEPLSVSVNAVDVSGLQAGDRALVLGPGMIGLGIALIAQARGAEVTLAGFADDARLSLAREMGITQTVDLREMTLSQATQHSGAPDVVFEATGRPASVVEGLELLRPGGVLAVVGIHAEPAQIDLTRLVRGKKQLRGCHDTTPSAFAEAITRLAEAPDLYRRLITHRLPLAEYAEGFRLAKAREAMKVMLIPEGTPDA